VTGPRLGIDLGGTKIEGVVMARDGEILARERIPAPKTDYPATLEALLGLVRQLEAKVALGDLPVGIGMPGSLTRGSGHVQNANSTWLNGRPLREDLIARLGNRVRLANDANCFALSEATDGAAAGARTVFGVIVGTGAGGGIVIDGRILEGARRIGGEWGHNPLPWPTPDEYPGPRCWCGRHGCHEVWVSGSGLAADHARVTGEALSGEAIVGLAASGDAAAKATLARHAGRLARGLAHVCNIIDPDVIVLGGGLSRLDHLYAELPGLVAPHLFTDEPGRIDIRRPKWGDASGVRGAAWLWE
jgi:fructokinase